MTEPKKHAGKFYWSITLDVECPYCDLLFDANNTDDFFVEMRGVQVCEGKRDIKVVCPRCEEWFVFDIGDGT